MTQTVPTTLFRKQHIQYLVELGGKGGMSSFRAESLKMGGMYWGLTAMRLLGVSIDKAGRSKCLAFIDSCFDGAAFGWSSGHDAHITATHYAMLLLVQLEEPLSEERRICVQKFISENQNSDGSFRCDKWGETDLRFAYDAVCVLALSAQALGQDWKSLIDFSKLCEWIVDCQNSLDGGFGPNPRLESHAAYTFCAVAALSICGQSIPCADRLAHWLCERQTVSGGFNGRPEKAPDVCYSWWILSTLSVLKKTHWIDQTKLAEFILRSQSDELGGIADRPDCVPDVFHTFFGLAGLSLIDRQKFHLLDIDPLFALPRSMCMRVVLDTDS